MSDELITSHVWRSPHSLAGNRGQGPAEGRPCEFMNCRRPKGEHARAVSGAHRPRRGGAR